MNIAVIGATGATGLEFLQQALEAGHNLTALVRSPEKVTIQHPNLQIIKGSALEINDVAKAVTGQDAIFIALGTGKDAIKSTIRQDGTRVVVDALKQSGEKPFLVVMSSLGTNESFRQVRFYWRMSLPFILGNVFADHAVQEEIVRESGLPHIFLRPTNLGEDAPIGNITPITPPKMVPVWPAVTRADVVTYALQVLQNPSAAPEAVALAKAH